MAINPLVVELEFTANKVLNLFDLPKQQHQRKSQLFHPEIIAPVAQYVFDCSCFLFPTVDCVKLKLIPSNYRKLVLSELDRTGKQTERLDRDKGASERHW